MSNGESPPQTVSVLARIMPEKGIAFLRAPRYSITLLLLISGAFLFLLHPSIRGHDGVLNYAYLRSALLDRDLDFSNDYAYYLERQARWFNNEELPRDPVTNLPINLYGVGSSLLWAPWVLTVHVALHAAQAAGAEVDANGFSRPYEWAVGLGSCFYASLGLWLAFRFASQGYGRRAAFWSLLVVWLASPLVFYMYLHPSMSHSNSFFLAALLAFTYARGDSRLRWLGLGFIAGLLVATRFQDAALLGGIAAAELWRIRDLAEKGNLLKLTWSRATRYALFLAAAAVAFAPQLLAWHILQGSAWSGPRAYMMQGEMRPWAPIHATEVLFSSRHGFLFWHPLLITGVAGLFVARRNRRLALLCLCAFVFQWWAISSWSIWWAGASFGHRMFISALPFLALGSAALFARFSRSGVLRGAMVSLTLLGILWNLGYIVQYGSGMIDRQKGVPFSELTRNNVWRVPRLLLGIDAPPPPQDR